MKIAAVQERGVSQNVQSMQALFLPFIIHYFGFMAVCWLIPVLIEVISWICIIPIAIIVQILSWFDITFDQPGSPQDQTLEDNQSYDEPVL